MIRNKTKVKDILDKIKEARWRWAGHITRRDDNRWTKNLLNGNKERKEEEGKTKTQIAGQLDCICGHSLAKISAGQK